MMNRSMMPKQIQSYRDGGVASLDGNVRTFNNDGIATLLPRETKIMDQDHMLAYITPDEAQTLMDLGGAGTPGPGGVPQFGKVSDFFKEVFSGGTAVTETFNPSEYSASTTDSPSTPAPAASSDDDKPARVGIVDSVLMGLGIKDKTPEYYATTAQTIARTQGADAAESYVDRIGGNLNITSGLDSTGNIQSTGVAEALANVDIASAAKNFKPKPSGGGGGGSTPKPQPSSTGQMTPQQALDYLKATGDVAGAQAMLGQVVGLPGAKPASLQTFTDRFTKAYQAVPESQYGTYDFRKQIGAVDSDFRPTVQELMSVLNVDAQTAQNYLNPEGLQYDFRNWSEILQSSDPLKATKDATYAMYLTPELFGRTPAAFTPEGFDLANAQSAYLYGTDPNFFGTNFMLPTEQELQEIKDLQGQVKTLQGEVDSFGTITPISSGVYQYPRTTPPGPVYPEPPVPVTPLPEIILEDTIAVPAPITSTGTGFVMPDFDNPLQTTLPGLGPEEGILTLPSQGPA